MAGFTSARIGGPADALLVVRSADELVEAVQSLCRLNLPHLILGGGSNVLVSDLGIRAVVIINRARAIRFFKETEPPAVWAESGAPLNDIAQHAADLGLGGLEWASHIPGTLGGAVYGNAGAFDGTMAGNLFTVELFHCQRGRETWPVEKMSYGYRSSVLKEQPEKAVILAAKLLLKHAESVEIKGKMKVFSDRRKQNQPRGASMGSVFRNPTGTSAGRLIDAAGLKGKRIGDAEINSRHANFFINRGTARADDFLSLIKLARENVREKFNVDLELEIELIGDWKERSI